VDLNKTCACYKTWLYKMIKLTYKSRWMQMSHLLFFSKYKSFDGSIKVMRILENHTNIVKRCIGRHLHAVLAKL
jgi:hypothetical protein